MGKIISMTNQKGGVGKTTTCVNLASYLAAMGKKVLLIDIDPQGNASSGLGIEKHKLKHSIYHLLVQDSRLDPEDIITPQDCIIKTRVNNLDILPSTIELVGAEIDLVPREHRERVLSAALNQLRNNYDYITIDCPPSLGLLTINALTASDSVLIPIQGEFYALEGLSQLMNTVKLVKKHLNLSLEVEGVLLTMFDGRSNLVNSVAEEIQKFFGKKVFNVRIPRSIRLGEAPSYGLPIMQFDPRSSGAIAYKHLAEEVLARNNDTNYTKITKDYLLRVKRG